MWLHLRVCMRPCGVWCYTWLDLLTERWLLHGPPANSPACSSRLLQLAALREQPAPPQPYGSFIGTSIPTSAVSFRPSEYEYGTSNNKTNTRQEGSGIKC
jgi:hypothetical protein